MLLQTGGALQEGGELGVAVGLGRDVAGGAAVRQLLGEPLGDEAAQRLAPGRLRLLDHRLVTEERVVDGALAAGEEVDERVREELVGERALAAHLVPRVGAHREGAAHLGQQLDRLRHQAGEELGKLGIRLLAQRRRRRHARALEALPDALEPMRHPERVAPQLLQIVAFDLERPLLGRALQAREDLQVLPDAVAGEHGGRDLDRELHVVAALAGGRDLHRRRPFDARKVVYPEPQAHIFGAARRLGLGGLT